MDREEKSIYFCIYYLFSSENPLPKFHQSLDEKNATNKNPQLEVQIFLSFYTPIPTTLSQHKHIYAFRSHWNVKKKQNKSEQSTQLPIEVSLWSKLQKKTRITQMKSQKNNNNKHQSNQIKHIQMYQWKNKSLTEM